MKNKFLIVLGFIFCICISVFSSILIVNYKLSKINVTKDTEIVSRDVSIVEENTIKESIDKIYDSVVFIQQPNGSGTGFVYKKDDEYGYVLTNHHVVKGASKIKVTFNNEEIVDAELLGSDEYVDLAVLRVPVSSVMSVASMGESVNMNIGDTVFTVGSPLGAKYVGTVTKGILSGKDRLVSVRLTNGYYRMNVLQTDAAVNPGNSGGPLVNINGEVVGIISMKLVEDQIEGMGFAIPVEVAVSYAPILEKGEEIERPVLGVELTDTNSSYALYLYRIYLSNKVTYGTVVLDVEDDYPAASVLKRGDVIVEIDGQKIEDTSHFRYILYKYHVGDKIKIKYIRDGDEKEVEVVLDKGL